jgi:hypothetical protein
MKMGNIVSPRRYGAAACRALQSAKSATICDLALRLMAAVFPISQSVPLPSIAALSINRGIDVMCQIPT